MDSTRFDRLVRAFGVSASRRRALAGLLAGFLAPHLTDPPATARRRTGKHRARNRQHGRENRRRDRRRVRAEQLPARCCSRNPCTPGPGANLGKCCFEGANLAGQNFKGANLGSANFGDATLTNANFQGANLGKACLVDANLAGAIIDNSTNLFQAVFCRTTMPDGSINDSGCNRGTVCCPTCDEVNTCPAGQTCCNGRCVDLDTDANNCGACGIICDPDGSCQSGECSPCPPGWIELSNGECGFSCTEDGDCPGDGCETCAAALPDGVLVCIQLPFVGNCGPAPTFACPAGSVCLPGGVVCGALCGPSTD
ncbi:MAG: pentapeptide repeat-containing protein [Thermomicrobiales bacterium]